MTGWSVLAEAPLENPASGKGTAGLTGLLNAWVGGDDRAGEAAIEQIYCDVHRIACQQLSRERENHTLQPTALVGEVYLRLAQLQTIRWQSRRHFFGSVAGMIRRILVDHARKASTEKRGGQARTLELEEAGDAVFCRSEELLLLDRALRRLEAEQPGLAAIVEYRFFAGLRVPEIANLLGLSATTVKRRWRLARTWLHQQIGSTPRVQA